MSEKPILFSTPMVEAILAGRKTQTRRVAKPQPLYVTGHDNEERWYAMPGGGSSLNCYDAPYAVRDTLWVRETWANMAYAPDENITYRAGTPSTDTPGWSLPPGVQWRPSIHLPRRHARLFLTVKSVRVERLQEISEGDCYSEGTLQWADEQDLRHSDGTPAKYPSVRHAFRALWDGINAKRGYGWDANPWVWVYEFERCEAPRKAA